MSSIEGVALEAVAIEDAVAELDDTREPHTSVVKTMLDPVTLNEFC